MKNVIATFTSSFVWLFALVYSMATD